jgi:Tol biopolymer transport system component
MVPPIANMAQPDLLADGARIIAKGTGGDRTSLWTIDAHTGGLVSEQSKYSDDFHPSWSPEGTHFAYDSLHQGLGNYTLYTQKLDTRVDEVPMFQDAFILGTSPVWMEDDWLAYTGCDYWPDGDGSKCGIYRMPSWGARPFLIRPDSLTVRATDTFDSWLAFMSQDGGDWEVYVMPIQGGDVQNLSNSPSSQDGLGAFAPDGRALAFVSNRSGAWAIWVVNLDGTGLTRLFDLPGPLTGTWSDEHIAWGP